MDSNLQINNSYSILFICTANLIRSPFTEALFRSKLIQNGMDNNVWKVESAGTWAKPNIPPLEEARTIAAKRGLDITNHLSRQVTSQILSEFQLILTMETGQKEALQVEFPKYAKRIFTLSEMAGEQLSIDDPVGGSKNDYEQAFSDIEYWIDLGWERIIELTKAK
jgi:protein-tyrosine-phosphatase